MTASAPLILYSRADCHLCEVAVGILEQAHVNWRPVDIDSDPELTAKYGIHVPVLKHPESGSELFFPFNTEMLGQFLQSVSVAGR